MADTEAALVPAPCARDAAWRILREVEDLRVALHREREATRICMGALRHIDALLSGHKARLRLVRELAQGAIADAQRLAPEPPA